MNIQKQILTAAFFVAAAVAPLRADVVIDLKTGLITDTKTPVAQAVASYTSPYFSVTMNKTTTCPATPWEALVTINMKPTGTGAPPEVKVASIDVTFDGPSNGPASAALPTGWAVHIGDDPTNDGYGGGGALDGGAAEVHITNQQVLVYSSALDVGVVEKVIQQDLQPGSGSINFEVGNQWLSWGNPYNELDSAAAKKLFQIPDKYGDYKIYAAFNRVISGRADRKGCGTRRAVIGVR